MNNNKCCICHKPIPTERIEALNMLGILQQNQTCIECATTNDRNVKAVWSGMTGNSKMILVDSLGRYGIPKDDEPQEPTELFEEPDIEQEILD